MFVILEWLTYNEAVAHETVYGSASSAQAVADRMSRETDGTVEYTVYELREADAGPMDDED